MAVVHDLVLAPPTRGLLGSVPVASDQEIGTLALACAAIAHGKSEVKGATGPDAMAMIDALRALGVDVATDARGTASVSGVGLTGLAAPPGAIDCRGSLRTLRLLAGLVSSCAFKTELGGDADLLAASVVPIVDALRRRGASIEGAFSETARGKVTPPLRVGPLGSPGRLSGIEYELAHPSPDVKEALLLSGLFADEATYVRERIVSRDHAERLLQALDVPLDMAGPIVRLDVESWNGELPALATMVPGDVSAAIFFLAAGMLVSGSRVCVRGTGLNRTRTGVFELVRQMGGAVDVEVHETVLGEPVGVACASHASLRAVTMGGETFARVSSELPVLLALAARARGETEVPSDGSPEGLAREERLVSVLRSFGLGCDKREGALIVSGRADGPHAAADLDARGDADVAAMATLLALIGDGPSRVRHVDGLARALPRFVGTLRALGVDARVEERSV
jgi:3-phosphoshikimate 1-carboxyvinyltransferase